MAAQMTAFTCYRNPLCGLRNTFHLFPTPSCPIPPQADTWPASTAGHTACRCKGGNLDKPVKKQQPGTASLSRWHLFSLLDSAGLVGAHSKQCAHCSDLSAHWHYLCFILPRSSWEQSLLSQNSGSHKDTREKTVLFKRTVSEIKWFEF